MISLLYRCTAYRADLDNDSDAILHYHEHTQVLMNAFASHFLWKKYGIVDDILVKLILVVNCIQAYRMFFYCSPSLLAFLMQISMNFLLQIFCIKLSRGHLRTIL